MSPERFLLRVEGLTMDMDPSSPDQGMQVNTLKWTCDVILSDALFKYNCLNPLNLFLRTKNILISLSKNS